MKMSEYYTAEYSDGRKAYEKPLEWIYKRQYSAGVTIKPSIWLWGKPGFYVVDFAAETGPVCCGAFRTLQEAEALSAELGQMEREEFEKWIVERRKNNDY